MSRRIIVLVVDDTESAGDLSDIFTYAVDPPWKSVPEGENRATYQQERWDQESTDELLLDRLKRLAPHVHWVSNSILPDEPEAT